MATLESRTNNASNSGRTPRIHLDFLDGIRASAALLVMTSHLWRTYTEVALPGVLGFLTNWLIYGHLWVNVFIVLSGFCLMLPVTRSRTLRGGWQTFYKSRARRILPPLYAAIALAIVLSLLHHSPVSKETLFANILLLQDLWQSKDTLDGPLWSVALEWRIYFLFPLLVWLWVRFGPSAVLLVSVAISGILLVLLSASHRLLDAAHGYSWMNHACSWYVFLFAMGMISAGLALSPQNELSRKRNWAAWVIVIVAIVANWAQVHFWMTLPQHGFWNNFLNTLYLPVLDSLTGLTVAAFLFLLTRTVMTKAKSALLTPMLSVFSWQPLVFVGTFAYSIYLIHLLLIYDVKSHLVAFLHTDAPSLIIPIAMAVVVPISYLFHRAFERPFMSSPGTKIKTEAQAEAAAVASPAP